MKNRAPLLLALALLCAVPLFAIAFPFTPVQQTALGITTVPLRAHADAVVLGLPAQVTVPANREQIVSAPLAGLAVSLFVVPHQTVKRGAPLLRIVSPELGALQLQLMQATSRASLARRALQREQSLFKEGIIAERRVVEAQAALVDADATRQQAGAALRLAGMAPAAIARVAASGKPEEGVTLHATQAGIVTAVEVKPGQRVEPSTVLLRVAQTDQLALEIQAPAAQAANWRIGSKVSLQDRTGTATVASISPVVSGASQTVALRADVAAGSDLRPGELVTVRLPLAAGSAGWDVPLAALAHDGQQAFVFVRTSAGFDARAVKVLGSAAQRVRVAGALKEGELVAVSGVVALKAAWLASKGGE